MSGCVALAKRRALVYSRAFYLQRSISAFVKAYDGLMQLTWNIGIPQGSPLSPDLFLYLAAPLIDSFGNKPGFGTKVTLLSYVDDTYLLVTSETFEENCDLLEKHFKEVSHWAEANKVAFEPSKYEVMHFQHPHDRKKPRFKGVPAIVEGIQETTSMRILGVEVDYQLTWAKHVKSVGCSNVSRFY